MPFRAAERGLRGTWRNSRRPSEIRAARHGFGPPAALRERRRRDRPRARLLPRPTQAGGLLFGHACQLAHVSFRLLVCPTFYFTYFHWKSTTFFPHIYISFFLSDFPLLLHRYTGVLFSSSETKHNKLIEPECVILPSFIFIYLLTFTFHFIFTLLFHLFFVFLFFLPLLEIYSGFYFLGLGILLVFVFWISRVPFLNNFICLYM
jgi:hypothetical protein